LTKNGFDRSAYEVLKEGSVVKNRTLSWHGAPDVLQEFHMNTGVGKHNAKAPAKKTVETHRILDQQRFDNLSIAMHGEAFAHVKYLLYAEHARKSDNKELADSFEKTAKTERCEHFAEEARLAGLVGSDADNFKGESHEIDTVYLEFTQKSKVAGDTGAAARFEEIRHVEMSHRDVFKTALAKLESKLAGE
jgi:rubrerythrin